MDLCEITAELVRRNRFEENVYVRPLAYKSAQRVGVSWNDESAFFIAALPYGDYFNSTNGLHAGVVSWRRVEDNAIPSRGKISGAYVNSALAGDEARRNGFDEGIFLSENGHVAEGATCNMFLVRAGKLITPSPSDNILEGVTRNTIIELAHDELHLNVVERSIDRSELYVSDEAFFTGTAVEIAPIVRIDHRPVGLGEVGPVTTKLRSLFFEATRGHMPEYRKWLLPAYQPLHAEIDLC
jgi:branched-chain amino acid aminotransferase